MDLILRTANGDFDLFGNESIVQTLGIFSFNDITAFNGEYTNVFNLPLTNNNRKLIEYADFIPSINTAPYKKIPITLIVGGLDFKTGFIVIDSISDVIKTRVFSGNANFYELLKSIYLNDLDWSDLNHTWNYANAVASSANISGYIYPVMDYGGQTLSSDIVDIRKILPATFVRTILKKIFEYTDYEVIDDFDRTDLIKSVLAYTNKNPIYPASYITLNSFDGSNIANYGTYFSERFWYNTSNSQNQPIQNIQLYTYYLSEVYIKLDVFTNQGYWQAMARNFACQTNGIYSYNLFIDMLDYTPYDFQNVYCTLSDCDFYILPNITNFRFTIEFIREVAGVPNIILSQDFTSAATLNGKITLNAGDIFYVRIKLNGLLNFQYAASVNRFWDLILNPTVLSTNTLSLTLDPNLAFGNPITYSTLLPKIKCNDFIKDLCIRFGLILNVNEDTKTVTISQIDKLTENIPNAVNWSDKLDESDLPNVQFMYDNYAQVNLFTHAEDKTVVNKQIGGDYNLLINNANLESSKTFYTSPFSECDNTKFNNTITSVIPTYNTTSILFDKDVKPKILFSEAVNGLFKFTDGTSTSGYINTKRVYFIDLNVPNLCMGFESSLIPKNSQTLVSTLQNIRIVKANFNLNINDIKSIDWLTPVYIEQFQSYFFVTSINQFNYTNPDLTEVELIKLNP